jgi:hypothetical protein
MLVVLFRPGQHVAVVLHRARQLQPQSGSRVISQGREQEGRPKERQIHDAAHNGLCFRFAINK